MFAMKQQTDVVQWDRKMYIMHEHKQYDHDIIIMSYTQGKA